MAGHRERAKEESGASTDQTLSTSRIPATFPATTALPMQPWLKLMIAHALTWGWPGIFSQRPKPEKLLSSPAWLPSLAIPGREAVCSRDLRDPQQPPQRLPSPWSLAVLSTTLCLS